MDSRTPFIGICQARWLRRLSLVLPFFLLSCDGGSSSALPSDDPPQSSPIDQTFFLDEDTTYSGSFTLPADLDAMQWRAGFSLLSVPRRGSFSVNPDALGFSYTPEGNFAGVDWFIFSIEDYSQVTATLQVANVNDDPVLQVEIVRVIEQGQRYNAALAVVDPDLSDTHRFAADNLPSWLELDPQSGRLTGLPGQSEIGLYGDISFSVTDSAGATDIVGGVAIEVLDINDAPTINVSQFPTELLARQTLSVNVFPDDPDGERVTVRVEDNEFINTAVLGTSIDLQVSDVVEVMLVNLVIIATESRGQETRAIV
nr:putative Ig domain-containing protein [Gammaproteobacteria bacterium]